MSGMAVTERRRIGKDGPEVSAIGLGCMSLSGVYGTSDDAAGIALIHQAIDLGVDFLDSSDMYGWGQNEELLGRALKGRRDKGRARHANSARPSGPAAPTASTAARPTSPRPARRASSGSGSTSSTSITSTGSIRRCRSRRRSARWRGSSSRARCAFSACARRGPSASAAPTRSTRSPRCRANFRCSTARRRPRPAS